MKRSPDFTNIMTECPLEHHAGFPWLKEELVAEGFASSHAQLSVRGRRVLDRLLALLPSHLKSQSSSQVSLFPPALLFSICGALQPDRAADSTEQNDPPVLPSVLSKLRDWRLLDPDYRYSPEGIHKLALGLAGITDEASTATTGRSDLNRASHARLRVKWVSSDSPSESQDRESPSSTPPSPTPSRSHVLDSAQQCAHALPDLNERRSDAGHESCQAGRLDTPDSEDASAVVSPRQHSVSGFRSGCSACRHLRVSGPSNPSSPHMASVPLSDTNQFDMTSVPSHRHTKPSVHHTPKKMKLKYLQSVSRSAHVDENEPPPSKSKGVQQGIGISFPRQRTYSPRISNALLPRDPFSPVAASVQWPSHPFNHARQGDKHTSSHRVASVDLRLTMGNPCPNPASPNDLHPHAPTRAQSFSYSPVKSHGVGNVGAGVPKLASNAVGSRSSKRLPSWTRTHLVRHPTTTTSATPQATGSPPPSPAKARFSNVNLLPLGVRSRPSSTSIPPRVPSDLKHRERRSVSSQTHKHTSSVPLLPFSPASPLIRPRKWQV